MPRIRATLAALTATVLACALLAGCTAQAQTGAAAIFVKDAAIDEFSSLQVTFGEVAIHQEDDDHDDDEDHEDDEDDGEAGDDHDEDGEDQDEDDASSSSSPSSTSTGQAPVNGSVAISIGDDDAEADGWLILSNETTTVDLMAFTGDASAFLAGADVPPGSYDQVRLQVISARGTLLNGSSVPVEVPSGKLRIHADFDVDPGQETALTLDFDLEHSIVKTGDGRYLLKPVIHMKGEHHDRPDHDERERRERDRDEHDEDDHDDESDD